MIGAHIRSFTVPAGVCTGSSGGGTCRAARASRPRSHRGAGARSRARARSRSRRRGRREPVSLVGGQELVEVELGDGPPVRAKPSRSARRRGPTSSPPADEESTRRSGRAVRPPSWPTRRAAGRRCEQREQEYLSLRTSGLLFSIASRSRRAPWCVRARRGSRGPAAGPLPGGGQGPLSAASYFDETFAPRRAASLPVHLVRSG